MNDSISAYKSLSELSRELALLGSASSLLGWDEETYMPPKALNWRAEQLSYFGGKRHRMFTSPQVGAWISECEEYGYPAGSVESANLREWRHAYDRATKLPSELVEEMEKTSSLARNAWVKARKQSDYSIFIPLLDKTVELKRRAADLWGYTESPYDALMDDYERGAKATEILRLFETLQPAISALLPAAVERSRSIPEQLLAGHYPVEKQKEFNRKVAEAFGFDFEAGRIDTTAHPFCSGIAPGDTRLTTRYDEADFTSSLYGVLHETGHGLYEQGLPEDFFPLPIAGASSLGIHESQSRLWENHVGRTLPFWNHWYDSACDCFPHLRSLSPEQIYRAVTRATPSLIRVEADEVTYDLHIILRFQLEKELIEGMLSVADIPRVWNERFEAMFGMAVPDDAHGCLQDIHWSMGGIGYFCTYTLGNLNAAQLMATAKKEIPHLEDALARGQYQPLLDWLRTKIHRHGSRFSPKELIVQATGEPTCADFHFANLKNKYTC